MFRKKINLYQITYFILIIKTLCGISKIFYNNIIDNILMVVGVGFAVMIMFKEKYTLKRFVFIFGLGIIIMASCYYSGVYSLGISYLVIALCANKNVEEFIRVLIKTQIAFLTFHVLYSAILILKGNIGMVYMNYSNGIRFSFAMTHPNVFSLLVVSILIEWIWLNSVQLNKQAYFACCIICVITYCFTKTDAVLIVIAFLILYSCANNVKLIQLIFNMSARVIFPMLSIFIIILSNIYKIANGKIGIFVKWLDVILSRRIAMAAFAAEMNPLRLFARQIKYYTGEYNFTYGLNGFNVDNVYLAFMYNYGLIYIILISIAFYILARKNDYRISFLIVLFSAYGFVESQVMLVTMFPCLLVIAFLARNRVNSI